MGNIKIEDIGNDTSLTPIEKVMRDKTPETIYENNSNIIVNLHPTDGSHWVLVIRGEGGATYYFDGLGVDTPPISLEG